MGACSNGPKVLGSKSCHGSGLVKHRENLGQTKNVNGVFLKGKGKKEKVEKRVNTGELEIGRYMMP